MMYVLGKVQVAGVGAGAGGEGAGRSQLTCHSPAQHAPRPRPTTDYAPQRPATRPWNLRPARTARQDRRALRQPL